MDFSPVELIGYLGSLLIVVSLLITSVMRFRVVNLIGAAVFAGYGLAIGSLPIVITNGVIALIDVWFIWKATTDEDYFTLLEVSHDSPYLRAFVEFHGGDIARFQPHFTDHPGPGSLSMFILRDMVPAGVFIGHVEEEGVMEVDLDFVIPAYRDFRVAEHLFDHRRDVFLGRGTPTLRSPAGSVAHRRYLEKMGFVEAAPDVLELSIV